MLQGLPPGVGLDILGRLSVSERLRAREVHPAWRALLAAPAAWAVLDLRADAAGYADATKRDDALLRAAAARAGRGGLRELRLGPGYKSWIVADLFEASVSAEAPSPTTQGAPRAAPRSSLRVLSLREVLDVGAEATVVNAAADALDGLESLRLVLFWFSDEILTLINNNVATLTSVKLEAYREDGDWGDSDDRQFPPWADVDVSHDLCSLAPNARMELDVLITGDGNTHARAREPLKVSPPFERVVASRVTLNGAVDGPFARGSLASLLADVAAHGRGVDALELVAAPGVRTTAVARQLRSRRRVAPAPDAPAGRGPPARAANLLELPGPKQRRQRPVRRRRLGGRVLRRAARLRARLPVARQHGALLERGSGGSARRAHYPRAFAASFDRRSIFHFCSLYFFTPQTHSPHCPAHRARPATGLEWRHPAGQHRPACWGQEPDTGAVRPLVLQSGLRSRRAR